MEGTDATLGSANRTVLLPVPSPLPESPNPTVSPLPISAQSLHLFRSVFSSVKWEGARWGAQWETRALQLSCEPQSCLLAPLMSLCVWSYLLMFDRQRYFSSTPRSWTSPDYLNANTVSWHGDKSLWVCYPCLGYLPAVIYWLAVGLCTNETELWWSFQHSGTSVRGGFHVLRPARQSHIYSVESFCVKCKKKEANIQTSVS